MKEEPSQNQQKPQAIDKENTINKHNNSNKQQDNTRVCQRMAGVDVWVLNHQISELQMSSRTGAQAAATLAL